MGPDANGPKREDVMMQGVGLLAVQVVVTFAVVAVILPFVIALVPVTRDPGVGPPVAVGVMVAVFAGLRVWWPKPKR